MSKASKSKKSMTKATKSKNTTSKTSSTKKTLSFIMPVYNAENFLRATVEKILAIKIPGLKIELIAVDDCSTDSSRSILREYPLVLVAAKTNRGISHARNLGLKRATGDYIMYIDSDDDFEPKYLLRAFKKLEETDSDFCVLGEDIIDEKTGVRTGSRYHYPWKTLEQPNLTKVYLEDKIDPAAYNKLFRASFAKNFLFNDKLKVGEDIFFCLEIFTAAHRVCFSNAIYYHYIQHDSSIMHTVNKNLLQFSEVPTHVPIESRQFYEQTFPNSWDYFKLQMYSRSIHAISANYKHAKSSAKSLLASIYDKDKLKAIESCPYYSRFVRLEMKFLRLFGINFHLSLMPFYNFIKRLTRHSNIKTT